MLIILFGGLMKWFIIILMLINITVSAKLYKYRDSDGSIHYVDDISKIPDNKVESALAATEKFLPTNIPEIDKMRRLVSKNGKLNKDFENQQIILINWCDIIKNSGYESYDAYSKQISNINVANYKTKKQKNELSVFFAKYFKLFENEWVNVYQIINFKSTGNGDLDDLRRSYKKVPTSQQNLESRVGLIEIWAKQLELSDKTDKRIVKDSMKKLNDLYDVPTPDISALSKHIDKIIDSFEKEYTK